MERNIEVKITDSPSKLAKRVAKLMVNLIRNSGHENFNIALSGGTTPVMLFDRLISKYPDLPEWTRVHFWWGDERCVSPDSENSNYRLAYDRLFRHLPVPEGNVHRINGEMDPEAEAQRYSVEIREKLPRRGDWPVFDLILLGMGDDGHTASIFPDRMDLLTDERLCAVACHPETDQMRITLTGNVLNNANQIIFMVSGPTKAARISEIMNNIPAARKLPAYHIYPVAGNLYWFLDADAAGEI